MAFPKVLIATIFLSLVVLNQVLAIRTNDQSTNVVPKDTYSPTIECGGACEARCKLSSRPHLCKRACGTCCARCQCVPPGTSGNYESCPCYANMTTRNNKPKCP